jgi:hypothetical protein
MDFLSRALNYENEIFEEYLAKRKELINFIQKLDFETLDKKQKIVFIENFKNVVDPLKTSISEIDTFNKDLTFKNINERSTQVNLVYLLYLALVGVSSDETLETEISESESL